jgi:PilZ domain
MERRARQRKKTRLSVRFGAERPDKLGLITDVSAHGLYISTNAILPCGSAVHVHVPVPGGDPVLLDGRVTRSRRVAPALVTITTGGMGVQLENAPPAWRTSQALPEDR